MEIIKVIGTSILSLFALFIMSKLMGNKQISQLTLFDYIVGISIGSIAAEMATELEKPLKPFVALAVYAVIDYLLSVISQKSLKGRKKLLGSSLILMKSGSIYPENFKKAKIDLSEFCMEMRNQGYFDLNGVDTVFFEPNGKLSIMPYSFSRPATPDDLQLVPKADKLQRNIIVDGVIIHENLKSMGLDENWLKKELKSKGIKNYKDVFLACADDTPTLTVFNSAEQ